MRTMNATGWSAAGRFSAAVGAVGIATLLVLTASPTDFGRFVYAQSIAFVVANISLLGVNVAIVSFYNGSSQANDRHTSNVLSHAAWWIGLITASFFCGLLSIDELGLFWESKLAPASTGFPVLGMWSFSWSLRLICGGFARAKGEIRDAAVTESILFNASILVSLSIAAAFKVDLDYRELVLICNVFSFLSFVAGLLRLVRGKPWSTCLRNIGHAKLGLFVIIWGESIPLFLANVLPRLAAEAGLWIVANRCSLEEVACYGIAFRASQIVSLPTSVMASVLLPVFSKLHSVGTLKKSEDSLQSLFQVSTLIGVLSCVCIFGSFWLLPALQNPAYENSLIFVAFLCTGRLSNLMIGPADVLLSMTGNQRIVLKIVMACELIGILLAMYLVGPFGAIAVAAISAIALFVRNCLCWFVAREKLLIRTDSFSITDQSFRPISSFKKLDVNLQT